ncbi:MAG: carboxypeptidase-like regulatory domain-containing protein [Acidobacteriota bacterium]
MFELLALSLFIASASPQSMTLSGCVGEPGIEVVLHQAIGSWTRHVAEPEPIDRVTTGADGCFALRVDRPILGEVVVIGGSGLRRVHELGPIFEDRFLPVTELPATEPVRVRVRDAEGRPLAGADVRFDAHGGESFSRMEPTGDDGEIVFPRPVDASSVALHVGHPDHLDYSHHQLDGRVLDVVLEPGVRRAVVVRDHEGKAVSEAMLSISELPLPLAISGEDGSAVIAVHPEVGREVMVVADTRVWSGMVPAPRRDDEKPFVIELPEREEVVGVVRDAVTGEPVAGALVWSPLVPEKVVITREDGTYRVAVWPLTPGGRVSVGAAGYRLHHGEPVDVVELEPERVLSGRVVDAAAAPVADVTITVHSLGWVAGAARSTADGTYRIAGLKPENAYEVVFEHADFARHKEPLTMSADESTRLDVTLDRGVTGVGLVIDETGEPVVGALVSLVEPPPSKPFPPRPEPHRYETVSDGEGRFELTALAAGEWDLEVDASGFARAEVAGIDVSEEEARTDLGAVTLTPGTEIEGRVLDSNGQPLAEVAVTTRQRVVRFGPGARERSEATYTGLDGRFTLADLAAGQPHSVHVKLHGYGEVSFQDLEPPLDQALEIILERLGRIAGQAHGENGEIVKGVMVYPSGSRRSSGGYQRVTQDGRFGTDVPAGTYQVEVKAPGWLPTVLADVEVLAGETTELDVTMRRGAKVTGRVTDVDGAPVAGARVTRGVIGLGRRGVETGEDGSYELGGIEPGRHTIKARHRQLGEVEGSIEVRETGANVLDLVLRQPLSIRGRVIDATGASVAGAQVRVGIPGGFQGTRSKSDGSFEIPRLDPGRYRLFALHRGASAEHDEMVVLTDRTIDGLVLTLEGEGATIRGRVHGIDADAAASIRIDARSEQDRRQGRLDFEGGFVFDELSPGVWEVSATGPADRDQERVRLESGDDRWIELDLEARDGISLSGVVRADGAPAVHARVNLIGVDVAELDDATTDFEGRFQIDGLAAGGYRVVVRGRDGGRWQEIIQLDESRQLDIDLVRADLRGVVLDSDGQPVSRATIKVQPPGPEPDMVIQSYARGHAISDERGRFTMSSVPPGRLSMVVEKRGFATAREIIEIDGDVERTIVLEPGTVVRARVLRADGIPVSRVAVGVFDGAVQVSRSFQTVVDGLIVIDGISEGSYTVLVHDRGTGVAEVAANAPGPVVDVVLPASGRLRLRVPALVENDGVAHAVLTATDGRHHRQPLAPDPRLRLYRGETEVRNLAVGTWTVSVTAGDRQWQGQVVVAADATAELVLE